MQVHRARAFTHSGTLNGKAVIGNPASIVFCNEIFPSHEDMSRIAIAEKSPMSVFITQHLENAFDLEFYTPAGERFGLCGHGTLVAAYFIHQFYGYESVYFYKSVNASDVNTLVIKSERQDGNFKINMPAFKPIPTKSFDVDFKKLLGVDHVEAVYLCKELNDIILVLRNAAELRNATPLFHELAVILNDLNIRGLFLTAPSDERGIDYEVRIFAPHLGINEDISCGSANCSLLPYWHEKMKRGHEHEYTILCPYNGAQNCVGGIEIGRYNSPMQHISIGGMISVGQNTLTESFIKR